MQQLLSGTPTTSQRVASSIIKETDSSYLSPLGPKPLPLVTKNPPKKQLFTVENMGVIQKDLNLSNNKVVTLVEDLRVFAGSRNVTETGLKCKLKGKNRQLNELFVTRKCTFAMENMKEKKSRSKFQQHVVVCNDLNALIKRVVEEKAIC